MIDKIKKAFQDFWMSEDIKPKRRRKQLVHKKGRQGNKRDLQKEIKEYQKDRDS